MTHLASRRSQTAAGLLLGFVACVSGCHHAAPPKPLDQLTAREQVGHAVFQAHCSSCHHDRTDAPLNGPGLAGVFQKQYLPSGAPANDERVRYTIVHGRGNMPPQGYSMTDDELNDLLAYLHTL